MVTLGEAITQSSIEDAFEAVLKCCKQKKIKNLKVDRINYKLKGETPFSIISQRSKAKIIITLKLVETEESVNSTKIEIYDLNEHTVEFVPDGSFINPFQKCLKNLIPLKSKFELRFTEPNDKYSIPSDKGRKSRQKIFAVILLGAIVVIPLIGLAMPESNISKFLDEQARIEQEKAVVIDKEKEAIKLVQNYKGTDGSGSTINETIATIIVVSYAGEDIFNHPSTKFGWSAIKKYGSPEVYDVYFDWSSYDGSKTFHFLADFKNNKVWQVDDLSSTILKIVDAEG